MDDQDPCVRTIMGRYRHLTKTRAKSRGAANRAAVNTPIQGSAADIVMAAMMRLHMDEFLQQRGYVLVFPCITGFGVGVFYVYNIHIISSSHIHTSISYLVYTYIHLKSSLYIHPSQI